MKPLVLLLHGGPGAPGQGAPLARMLEDRFEVLAPIQRGSGAEELTVARHVADLRDVVRSRAHAPPALVGFSWGAMLALAYAASHPREAGPIVLIGCGTFDRASRRRMDAILQERMTEELRRQLDRLPEDVRDPDERLAAMGRLLLPVFSHELDSTDPGPARCDAQAHRETWDDMVRLQEEGVYPGAFAAIESPVLMLHGTADPHPGRLVRDSLAPFLRRLEFVELERCGHYPWLEKHARGEFLAILREWLARELASSRADS